MTKLMEKPKCTLGPQNVSSSSVTNVYTYNGPCDLNQRRAVKDDDVKSLIHLINTVKNCHSQLGEVNQIASITMSHINGLCGKLPLSVRKDRMRRYQSFPEIEKITRFTFFMVFLELAHDFLTLIYKGIITYHYYCRYFFRMVCSFKRITVSILKYSNISRS